MNYQNYFAKNEVVEDYTNSIESIGLWNSERIPLLNYVFKDANIIDIGTGAGRVAFNLYKLGYNNITATDFCSDILNKAIEYNTKINSNINIVYDDITDSQLSTNTFDAAIFSFNGLQLIANDNKRKQALYHINRILKDNGIFIFNTDNRRIDKHYKWFWNQELQSWKENKQDKRISHYGEIIYSTDKGDLYFHHYRHEELVELLVSHGFKVLQDYDVGAKYKESKSTLKFSGYSHMWVSQKILK